MTARIDIYKTDKKINRLKERVAESNEISSNNKETYTKFLDYCFASGLTASRVYIYAERLFRIALFLKRDFKEVTKDDIQSFLGHIEKQKWTANTKNFFKVTLKKFYKWYEGNDEFYPEKIRGIKNNRKNTERLLPEDLLNEEELEKLIDGAENPRDKAIISLLADGGLRPSELAGIRIKDLNYDEYGLKIHVDGKTGPRIVRLVNSVKWVTTWLENYPFDKNDPNAYVFIRLTSRNRGKPLLYPVVRNVIQKAGKKAGIRKRVFPYALRHYCGTNLAKKGLNENQMSKHMGWIIGTKAVRAYVHLSGRDTDEAILGAHGIKMNDVKQNYTKCNRCNTPIKDVSCKFCSKCGGPLTINGAFEIEEDRKMFESKIEKLMNLIEKDNEIKEIITDKYNGHFS